MQPQCTPYEQRNQPIFGSNNYTDTKNHRVRGDNNSRVGCEFHPLPKELLRNRKVSYGAIALLVVLWNETGRGQWLCTRNNDWLAEEISANRSDVIRYLEELEKAGMIARQFGRTHHIRKGIAVTWEPAKPVTESPVTAKSKPVTDSPVTLACAGLNSGIQETSTTATVARLEESRTQRVSLPVVDSVPESVVAEIASTLSPRVAEEVKTHPTQFYTAAGGKWENLLAGARAVRAALRANKPIRSAVAFLVAETRAFAARGIPEPFRTPPPVVVQPKPKPVELTPEEKAKNEAAAREFARQFDKSDRYPIKRRIAVKKPPIGSGS